MLYGLKQHEFIEVGQNHIDIFVVLPEQVRLVTTPDECVWRICARNPFSFGSTAQAITIT